MGVHAQQYWASRLEADAARLEERRQARLSHAARAAPSLRQACPDIRSIHLFGSILEKHFRDHSDLDLLGEGLPTTGLLEGIALAKEAGPLQVDLKRQEDFSDDLIDRLLRRSRPL